VKITAAISTYNRLGMLKKAIVSVENQTFLPCELIIVDDNSSDGTKEYCENLSLDFPVIYLRNDKNSGVSFSRNRAIEQASGEYIAFLDDDDEWLSEKLQKQNEFAENGFDLIYTALTTQKNDKIYFHRRFPVFLGCFAGSTSTMMFNLATLRKIGGFDPRIESMEEYDLLIRLVRNRAKIKGIRVVLVKYFMADSGKLSGSLKKYFSSAKIIMSKTPFFLKPLQFMGLFRIFAQKTVKLREFREVLFKKRKG